MQEPLVAEHQDDDTLHGFILYTTIYYNIIFYTRIYHSILCMIYYNIL